MSLAAHWRISRTHWQGTLAPDEEGDVGSKGLRVSVVAGVRSGWVGCRAHAETLQRALTLTTLW